MITYRQKSEGEEFVRNTLADPKKPLEKISIGGVVYTLPTTAGTAGQFLAVDATGTALVWTTP
jgi:hypothetical protein